ncbi:MAG: hypothetical protein K9L22_07855 [Methylococcaceae bacterium]|nr:hypothetical protein [Methylococcaceae bacterium]
MSIVSLLYCPYHQVILENPCTFNHPPPQKKMAWRAQDIIQAYTLRWLVEVFFEDWRLYERWGREAKQLGEEESSRGLILSLSLLFDHCLILHPEQSARIENKPPAYTVGSLQRKSQMDVLLEFINAMLEQHNPADKLKELAELMEEVFQLLPSGKHMSVGGGLSAE